MASVNLDIKKLIEKVLHAKSVILINYPFFGHLLLHLKLSLSDKLDTAATDGEHIYFGTDFLNNLSTNEVVFIILHEIMHVALKHIFRGRNLHQYIYNIACDIVVNSNILQMVNNDLNFITLSKYGTSMHLTPLKDEGYKYTAEEVYKMLIKDSAFMKSLKGLMQDEHSLWSLSNESLEDEWESIINDTSANKKYTNLPLGVEREIANLKSSSLNWRVLLNNFLSDEFHDYSFTPPDNRYDNSPFFLPAFNEKKEEVKDVIFYIDTSGSISKNELTTIFSEIKGAINQSGGKIRGKLAFFDCKVYGYYPISDVASLLKIIPKGGGGTSFSCIFKSIKKDLTNELPKQIIILTDGYAEKLNSSDNLNIDTLWIITSSNEKFSQPFGKVTFLEN